MRSKKTFINTAFALLEELVVVICGLILPRLILATFGSKYNGLTSSITQFLSCAVLLRSGIGGATRAALYKPLAKKNKDEVNSIIKATDIFMKRVGFILGIAICLFSLIYPLFVIKEFDYIFSFSLFLIIGISTFAESFFGITYLIVLQADQKLWVSSLFKSISYIINTILAFILIKFGCGIHIVKLGSALAFTLYPIFMQVYVRRKYKLNLNVEPNNSAISQRWDAFWHQVAAFVMNNTDCIILTAFSNMLELSVYTVYNMVIRSLKGIIQSFSNGLEAAFGNMIAKEQNEVLRENVSIIELILYSISTIMYVVTTLLILSFVSIYTKGVNDVNYIRPAFAYILIVAQFFNSIRLSYQLVVQAAGHYKQTKKGAIIEPILNIVLSIVGVIKFGLIGVAIGTLIATILRTMQYSFYMCKNIVKRSNLITIYKIMISFMEGALIIIIVKSLHLQEATNYLDWINNGIIVGLISTVVVVLVNYLLFNKDCKNLLKKLKNIFLLKKTNANK